MIALASRGMARIPHLPVFLGGQVTPLFRYPDGFTAFAGWGAKPTGLRAKKLADEAGLPCLLLEDGFLRSVERDDPPLSLVVDDLGIYYDAAKPSRIEGLIEKPLTDAQTARARLLTMAWRQGRVSKYNDAREYNGKLPPRYVLVVDQTLGDGSIRHGWADKPSFLRMIERALTEHPDCTIIVKTHPDVFNRKKRGHFDQGAIAKNSRIQVLAENCHLVGLLERAQAVYTVTSQVGFEALIWGKTVRCFGMPFYAVWGLTEDELPAPKRRGRATLEQLVHAALVAYPRYVDPETGQRCEAERIIEYIAFQRNMRSRFPRQVHAIGFSRWKRPILRKFFAGSELRFVRPGNAVPAKTSVAIWGNRVPVGLAGDGKVIRLEDGFLRSVGLGADFTSPLSWVQDTQGIYYDSSRPSDLERILHETDFDSSLLVRARALRERIVKAGLTKYNESSDPWTRPASRSVVLVIGQVEGDASIRFGAPGIRTNIELLRAVRHARPDAYIVYKPHPDVVAGHRARGHNEELAFAWCDEAVDDADIADMLGQVDEVHVLTSLGGFEALIRGIPVTCHGQPFYAGWGLTQDVIPASRRTRRLGIDELVAGSLVLYPTYVSRTTGRFTTPERAVDELIAWRLAGVVTPSLWRQALRLSMRLFRGFEMANHANYREAESYIDDSTEGG